MSKIKTIKELRSKRWYWWLKQIYFLLYLSYIIGVLNYFSSIALVLDKLAKSNISVSAMEWFWILFFPAIIFFFLFLFLLIVKRGFYYLVFKTTKPERGEPEKEKTMDELYQPVVKK